MKILMIHNFYQFYGGSDQVYENEKQLLENNGHEVIPFTIHNEEIKNYNIMEKIKFFPNMLSNRKLLKRLKTVITQIKPDVAHIHNIFPLISINVYKVLFNLDIPIIQSVHDHRLAMLCPQGTAYRKGKNCTLCFNGNYWNCLRFKCVKSNFLLSCIYAFASYINRKSGLAKYLTYGIYFNDYMYHRLKDVGICESQLVKKPHFIAEDIGTPRKCYERYFIYVGSISKHKGIHTLVKAFKELKSDFKLKILGDGVYKEELLKEIDGVEKIEYLGFVGGNRRIDLMKNASCTVMPSECFETFGLTILESLACAVPVIASDIGGFSDLVKHEKTGLLFDPGNSNDLKLKLEKIIKNRDLCIEYGQNAYVDYTENYLKDKNYKDLMGIYKRAIEKND